MTQSIDRKIDKCEVPLTFLKFDPSDYLYFNCELMRFLKKEWLSIPPLPKDPIAHLRSLDANKSLRANSKYFSPNSLEILKIIRKNPESVDLLLRKVGWNRITIRWKKAAILLMKLTITVNPKTKRFIYRNFTSQPKKNSFYPKILCKPT